MFDLRKTRYAIPLNGFDDKYPPKIKKKLGLEVFDKNIGDINLHAHAKKYVADIYFYSRLNTSSSKKGYSRLEKGVILFDGEIVIHGINGNKTEYIENIFAYHRNKTASLRDLIFGNAETEKKAIDDILSCKKEDEKSAKNLSEFFRTSGELYALEHSNRIQCEEFDNLVYSHLKSKKLPRKYANLIQLRKMK